MSPPPARQQGGAAAGDWPLRSVKRVHPDDAKRLWVAREVALDPADPKPCAIEFRLRWRGGEVRWVEVHWLAYFEGALRERGAASVVGTVADITERKEKEHLLVREINHRTKNMLSVVHAIANQTGAKNLEDFVQNFSKPIQALAANQDLLIRNEWHGGEIEDLVYAQLAPFADLIGSRIAARGPMLRLMPSSAQAMGLHSTNSPPMPGNTGRSRRVRFASTFAGAPMATPSP